MVEVAGELHIRALIDGLWETVHLREPVGWVGHGIWWGQIPPSWTPVLWRDVFVDLNRPSPTYWYTLPYVCLYPDTEEED